MAAEARPAWAARHVPREPLVSAQPKRPVQQVRQVRWVRACPP
jgi:hypothetical protein